jgi:hypothetical protein
LQFLFLLELIWGCCSLEYLVDASGHEGISSVGDNNKNAIIKATKVQT